MAEATVKHSPIVRLSEVDASVEEPRFLTGIGGLDAILSETDDAPQGLPYGCSVLVAGQPGAGKSTVVTYILASQGAGKDALYLHGEEKAERVRRRWDRLRLQGADPILAPLRHGEQALDVIRRANAAGPGLGVIIVDSVQTLRYRGRGSYLDQYDACEDIVGQGTSLGATVLLVSHVDKGGKAHKGSSDLPHLVDVHLHLTVDARRGTRTLENRKNRMGRSGYAVPMVITGAGITVGTPEPIAAMAMAPRNQQDRAQQVAERVLRTGRRLTAYDFDVDPGVPLSGPAWRVGLEAAARALTREGLEVVAERREGRMGYQVRIPETQTQVLDQGDTNASA